MSDVNAAAEIADHVLSRVTKTGACYGCVYPHGHPPPGIKEAYELASWFRKEHPADDGEAIDEAWLRSIGFVFWACHNHWSLPVRDDASLQVMNLGSAWSWCLHFDQCRAAGLEFDGTRGQLRRLLAAIG